MLTPGVNMKILNGVGVNILIGVGVYGFELCVQECVCLERA